MSSIHSCGRAYHLESILDTIVVGSLPMDVVLVLQNWTDFRFPLFAGRWGDAARGTKHIRLNILETRSRRQVNGIAQ